MPDRTMTVVVDKMTYTESPRWRDGRLWFVDMHGYRIMAVAPGSEATEIVKVPGQASGLGWLPDGRIVIASSKERRLQTFVEGGPLEHFADLSGIATAPLNDMVTAPDGTSYVGNFGFDFHSGEPVTKAFLARVTESGDVSRASSEALHFPNGSVITPDGRTLIVAESFGNRISAFDIAPNGTLGVRRDWAVFAPAPTSTGLGEVFANARVMPDGMGLDMEGCVWAADAVGNRAIRVREGGEIIDEVSTDEGCFAAVLGGKDGRTLFLCTAPDFDEHKRSAALEGRIQSTTVDVPHAGTP